MFRILKIQCGWAPQAYLRNPLTQVSVYIYPKNYPSNFLVQKELKLYYSLTAIAMNSVAVVGFYQSVTAQQLRFETKREKIKVEGAECEIMKSYQA